MKITLYGTLTSPYVRRVRIVTAELGLEYTLVDTSSDVGQAALRAATPLLKVPVAELDGQVVFDSHAIIDALLERAGPGPLRAAPADQQARWREWNQQHVIDGALDSAINVMFLRRDGINPEQVPYLTKQLARVQSALAWVERELDAAGNGAFLSADPKVGLPEIALFTALEWMTFRAVYPVAEHPALARFVEHHAERPSFAATRPR